MRTLVACLALWAASAVASAQPDLAAQFVIGPQSAIKGKSVTVTRSILSVGTTYNGSFQYEYRLSGTVIATITSNQKGQLTDPVTIPLGLATDTYTWELRVKPVTGETNMSNNLVSGGLCQVAPDTGDLCIDLPFVETLHAPANPNDPAAIALPVRNCSTLLSLQWQATVEPPVGWLQLQPGSGQVPPQQQQDAMLQFLAQGLPIGEYETTVRLANTINPFDTAVVPIRLVVDLPSFAPGDTLVGAIETPGDYAEATFEGVPGMQFKLDLTGDPTLSLRATLFNPLDLPEKTWTAAAGGSVQVKRSLTLSGRYRLRIEGADDSTGGFTTHTSRKLPKKSKPKVVTGKVSPTKYKEVKVLALEGATLNVNVVPTGVTQTPYGVQIIAPSGAVIDGSTYSSGAPPAFGTFIQGVPLAETGQYRVRINATNPQKIKATLIPEQPLPGANQLFIY